MVGQAGAKTCRDQLVGRSLAGTPPTAYQEPISRASSAYDEKGRGRQTSGGCEWNMASFPRPFRGGAHHLMAASQQDRRGKGR